jgi:hypothetical protein
VSGNHWGRPGWLWLEREFGWSDKTAHRFVRVASWQRKASLQLPVSLIYLLASIQRVMNRSPIGPGKKNFQKSEAPNPTQSGWAIRAKC